MDPDIHWQEGKPGLLRSNTGDSLVAEGVETRVNEAFKAPLFHLDDVVIRVGKTIHGEKNMGEPCTVVFVDKYATPYHYTVKDPWGQEIGIAETHIEPCEEIMQLADRENSKPVPYSPQIRFPEQQTKEGNLQDNAFRVALIPHEQMKKYPEEVNMPVVAAKPRYAVRRAVRQDDQFAKVVEQICWVIIITMGLFWAWVAVWGPDHSIYPLRRYWDEGYWPSAEELEFERNEKRHAIMGQLRNSSDPEERYEYEENGGNYVYRELRVEMKYFIKMFPEQYRELKRRRAEQRAREASRELEEAEDQFEDPISEDLDDH